MEPWMRSDSRRVESEPIELLMKVTMRWDTTGSPRAKRSAKTPAATATTRTIAKSPQRTRESHPGPPPKAPPFSDRILSISPPNMSECLSQAEVERSPGGAQVRPGALRVAELPSVVEPHGTDRGADPDSRSERIAHVGVARVGTRDREETVQRDVLRPLPHVAGIHEDGTVQDPDQREARLHGPLEEHLTASQGRRIGIHPSESDLVLEIPPHARCS